MGGVGAGGASDAAATAGDVADMRKAMAMAFDHGPPRFEVIDRARSVPTLAPRAEASFDLGVRVLGLAPPALPLELRLDGRPIPLPGGKPKAVLAGLLVSRNRVVPADSLADAIWDAVVARLH